jgi:hypothetical protein
MAAPYAAFAAGEVKLSWTALTGGRPVAPATRFDLRVVNPGP